MTRSPVRGKRSELRMNDQVDEKKPACADCHCEIDCCEFCGEPECPKSMCYACMIVAVKQEIGQPHPHGG
jgi:hypothetical protein